MRFPVILLILSALFTVESQAESQHISTSPDGEIEVRIRKTTTNRKIGEVYGKLEILDARRGKVLASWKTGFGGREKTGMWSGDGRYVAINDFEGNSGDVLYIVRVSGGKASLIRKPALDQIEKILKQSHSNWGNWNKISVYAEQWLDNDRVKLAVYGNSLTWPEGFERPKLFLYFDEEWVLSMASSTYTRVKVHDEIAKQEAAKKPATER